MKKTKREKLAAAARRQKEFERIRLSVSSDNFKKPQNPWQISQQEAENTILKKSEEFLVTGKGDEILSNLTNLSYLPKQLTKIILVTLGLFLLQVIIYLLIL